MNVELNGKMVIGVDLDLTLIDTRAATAYALGEVNRRCNASVDIAAIVARLGPPIRQELARWIPLEGIEEAVAVFRESFLDTGIEMLIPMPGALQLGRILRQSGGELVVITSRIPRVATACIEFTGIEVTTIVGGVTGIEKAAPMIECGAAVYIGDHPLDMQGANAAGIPGIGVTTGSHTRAELIQGGAACTVQSLLQVVRIITRALEE